MDSYEKRASSTKRLLSTSSKEVIVRSLLQLKWGLFLIAKIAKPLLWCIRRGR